MNINFKDILLDYETLVRTKVIIPLDTNDTIIFEFKPNNLPHLLGLNRLIDIPIIFEYNNNRKSAKDIYKAIKNEDKEVELFKESKYYTEIYNNKLCHFSSKRIMSLLKNLLIIKFNPKKIKDFDTKLDKVDYLFYEIIECDENKYDHFGIGFSNKNNNNYPNTFFVRDNKDYIRNQDSVNAVSIHIKDKNKNVFFQIYWENIRKSFKKNSHYKALVKLGDENGFDVNLIKYASELDYIDNKDKEDIIRHFRLLRLDEVTKAYKPYLDTSKWNNNLKQYLVDSIDKANSDYLPSQIKILINEYKP